MLRALLMIMSLLVLASPASAQGVGPTSPAPSPSASGAPVAMAVLQAEVDQADADLHTLSKSFGVTNLSDAQIQSRLAAIPPIQAKLADALSNLTPRLSAIDARLAQLGPAPGPGQPTETAEIAQTRRTLSGIRQTVDGEIKQSKLLQVEASQISSVLTTRRQVQLTAQLWTHGRSIIDPGLWGDFVAALPGDVVRLQSVLSDEGDALTKAGGSAVTVAEWIGAIVAAVLIAIPLRILLSRLTFRRIDKAAPGTRLRRTLLALGRVLVAVLTLVAALALIRGAFAGATTPVFDQLAPLVVRVTLFASFFEGLGRALLSPSRPSWRLAPIPDDVVDRIKPYPAIIGVTAALAALVRGMNTILGVSLPTSTASDCVTVLIEVIAVGAALAMIGRARSEHMEAAAIEDTSPHVAESRLPWIIVALLAWLTLAAALAAVVLGYVQMAYWLMSELVWVATVLASLFLLLRFADDLFPALLSFDGAVGRFLRIAIGLSKGALEQISVLLSGVSRLGLLMFGWAAILAPFGAGADDVFSRLTSSELVIRIGQVAISPGAVLGAIAVFVVGLFITRSIRGWLEKRYLPKTHLDVGLRTSLSTGVTYLGGLIAIVLTLGSLGFSFDKIALFASALSVGVGFGLQAIIGNFVSGLILLAERPVKVGDWIAIGDLEGDVKRINVRATEIEMQDRSKLIVPNSDLISKTVRNVTHAGSLGRVKIVLKTVDSADPAAVRDLMMSHLTGHAAILAEPAPAVYLSNVGDGALEFTAFAYVSSARLAYRTRSELLFQIVPDLKAHNIPLSNSTPIVNVGLADRTIEPGAGEAES